MYRWVDHTSELELRVEAETEADVLEEAGAALAELLRGDGEERAAGGGEGAAKPVTRAIEVDADDRPQLLAAWLEELVFLAESQGVVVADVRFETLDERGLRAVVTGERGDPPHLVKAVTYHRLSFERADGGWVATVVLDV